MNKQTFSNDPPEYFFEDLLGNRASKTKRSTDEASASKSDVSPKNAESSTVELEPDPFILRGDCL